METTTGLPELSSNFLMIVLTSSDAITSPPGESTFRITALTSESLSAALNCSLM